MYILLKKNLLIFTIRYSVVAIQCIQIFRIIQLNHYQKRFHDWPKSYSNFTLGVAAKWVCYYGGGVLHTWLICLICWSQNLEERELIITKFKSLKWDRNLKLIRMSLKRETKSCNIYNNQEDTLWSSYKTYDKYKQVIGKIFRRRKTHSTLWSNQDPTYAACHHRFFN